MTDDEYCPPIEEVLVEVLVQETLRPLLGGLLEEHTLFSKERLRLEQALYWLLGNSSEVQKLFSNKRHRLYNIYNVGVVKYNMNNVQHV